MAWPTLCSVNIGSWLRSPLPNGRPVSRMDSASNICETATRLFAQQGYDRTSIQSIAQAVGMTKQSLLYHYGSKEILRTAVLGKLFNHWRETLPQLLEAVTSGQERFDLLIEELVSFFRQDPDRARLIARELMDRPDEMRRLMAENLRPWLLLVAQYIRNGQQAGILRADIDPESYVLHVITLVISAIANMPIFADILPASHGLPSLSGGAATGGSSNAGSRHLQELVRLVRSGLFNDFEEERP